MERECFGYVCRCDEEHVREIELHIQVVILERMVLRRVQHFEQRRGRIAAPVGAELVDFVEHDHRIHRARVAQGTHEPAWQRADVGSAMTADFGFVPDAAERHSDELPAGCPGDRFANRRLTGSRRADSVRMAPERRVSAETPLGPQLTHRKIFGDPAFDVVKTGVIVVQYLPRVFRVESLLRPFRPRHRKQPIQIGADHGCFGVRVAHPLETREFTFRLLSNRFRHSQRPQSSFDILQ